MSKRASCSLRHLCLCLQSVLEVNQSCTDYTTAISVVTVHALLIKNSKNNLDSEISLKRRSLRTLFKRKVTYRLIFTARSGRVLTLKRLYLNGKHLPFSAQKESELT